jgi:hypothetical protein
MQIVSKLIIFLLLGIPIQAQNPWVIRTDGVGPVKIGMSLVQLNSVLHEHFSMPKDKTDQGCFYVNPRNHPQAAFMIEDGHLVRVDVNKHGIQTPDGIQVGDSEARAEKIYGSKLEVAPSQYSGDEGGHYLTLRSSDGSYGFRFETEKGKITTFYSGTYAAIQYVEGCE